MVEISGLKLKHVEMIVEHEDMNETGQKALQREMKTKDRIWELPEFTEWSYGIRERRVKEKKTQNLKVKKDLKGTKKNKASRSQGRKRCEKRKRT